MAWDKFDINSETLSGANSIHHTYGICYQNSPPDNSAHIDQQIRIGHKRKIKDITGYPPLQQNEDPRPYRKTPKMTVFQFNKYVVSPPVLYSNYVNYVNYVNLDVLWLVSFNSFSTVPMWTGWNIKRCDEDLPQQTVAYMKPIALSPTRTDVVRETLNRSKAVTESKFTIVSYDLAIAKKSKTNPVY